MLHSALSVDAIDDFDLELPLHPATDNAEHVARLLEHLIGLVEDFSRGQNASDTDVVQALTMATALRAAMAEAGRTAGGALPARLLNVDVQNATGRAA